MNIHEFGSRLRFVAQQRRFLLLIFYIAVIAGLYYLPGVFHPHSVEEIRLWVMGFGVWGPLVYVALYTVRPLPVSYTHLDVYKRQPLTVLCAMLRKIPC